MTETVMENLLTVRQVADMFNRTDETVRLWMRDKELPCIRFPGSCKDAIRFDKVAVKKWAKERIKKKVRRGLPRKTIPKVRAEL